MHCMTISNLINGILNGKIILREVWQPHVKEIKQYILTNIERQQICFPSIVAHMDEGSLNSELNGQLSIIDGSHRLKAFIQIYELAQKKLKGTDHQEVKRAYELLALLDNNTLQIQLFEGFTLEEKHQFYLDLNSIWKSALIS